MEITLEKIELVKDRTGVSYKEAKEALEAAGGSVVDAIIDIEESIDIKSKGKVGEQGAHIVDMVKEIVKKGNVSKIVVKKHGEVLLNLPVNVGILGTVLAPWAAVAGIIAAFGTKCIIEVVKDDGEIIEISAMASDTFGDVVEKGADLAGDVVEKGADVFASVRMKTSDAINKKDMDDDVICKCGTDEECDENCNCGCVEEDETFAADRLDIDDDEEKYEEF